MKMVDEIEAMFLAVDIAATQQTLRTLGAECKSPRQTMYRTLFDYPDRHLMREQSSWIRIRNEGDKITLTFKQVIENKFDGAKEIEVTVSSYEDTVAIFQAMGMLKFSEQETRRETWMLDGCQVTIDEWPWLEPFVEIEGPSQDAVQAVAQKMGYVWEDAVFGSTAILYRRAYPDILPEEKISNIAEIKFDVPPPDWFVKKPAPKNKSSD